MAFSFCKKQLFSFCFSKFYQLIGFGISLILSASIYGQTNPTAPAKGFNVFLHKGGNLASSEIQGALAVGGNFTLNGNYNVATQSAGSFSVGGKLIGLLVGGQVVYNSGNVLYISNGYVKIGNGTGSTVWYQDEYGGNSNLRVTNGGFNNSPSIQLQTSASNLGVSAMNNPVIQSGLINFDSAFATLQASSNCLSTYTPNVTVYNSNLSPIPSTGLPGQIKFNLSAGLNVLNVLGSDLNNVTDFIYNSNQPDANHIMIINVNAPGSFTWNVGNTSGAGLSNSPYIIYNFYNTTSLRIAGGGSIEGTIFAPYADIVNTSNYSSIEGQIIANSLTTSAGGVHFSAFNANIVSCKTCSPSSSTSTVSICRNSSYTFNGTTYTTPGTYKATLTNAGGCDSVATLILSYKSDSVFVWTGGTSTNWADGSNWCSDSLPASYTNVSIPAGVPNYPVCSAVGYTNNLSIAKGASLTVTGTLQIGGTINSGGTITDTLGTIVLNGTTAQTIPQNTFTNKTVRNLTVNNTAGVTLADSLYIIGILTPQAGTLNTNGLLTLVSSATNTAQIAQGSGNYINGTVTVQRYVPSKSSRKFSFLGSPIPQSIHNSWQNQIYITGPGTGGQPCGAGDTKYNSNGFDATITNTPSMLFYNLTKVNGNHWVSISSTYDSLTPGIGYEVNVRGSRNSADANCNNQINAASPIAPEPVTLSVTGTVTTGNLTVPVNNPSINTYTLLANPYPSPIAFQAFQASNSSVLANKMWTYSPYNINNYTTYSNGLVSNGAPGYDNTHCNYIASGQAFFVEPSTIGSVTFQESHKATTTVSSLQYFGTSNTQLVRVGLKNTTNSLLDEVVARFNSHGSAGYISNWDAVSFSSAAQTLTISKQTKHLAIATFPDSIKVDTIPIVIKSSATGTFKLAFSDFQGLDNSVSITLHDKYLSTSQDVRANQVYQFNVTSDTASVSTNRFSLILNAPEGLPVNFTGITGKLMDGETYIKWTVANETGIDQYQLEKSLDGITYSTLSTIKATGTTNYSAIDETPALGFNYYRIKATGITGSIFYSKTVQIANTNANNKLVKVYPTIVANNKFTIEFAAIPVGNYHAIVYDMLGKVVLSQPITSSIQSIDLGNKAIAAGTYQVAIFKDGKSIANARIVVERK